MYCLKNIFKSLISSTITRNSKLTDKFKVKESERKISQETNPGSSRIISKNNFGDVFNTD